MESFTPVSAAVGGALIGLAATLLLWLNGRIAGISGIAGGLFTGERKEMTWRTLFLAGLVGGVLLYRVAGGPLETLEIETSLPALIVGGLLVGFGTHFGSGCTSGHGVCGLARLSPRSLVATVTFLLVAGVTVFIVRHVMGG